jgi:hypothetical protein
MATTKYNLIECYAGGVPFYRGGHLKAFQLAGNYMNYGLASAKIDPTGTPSFRTPFAYTTNGADILSLYKIEGAISSARTYNDITALRTLVGSYVPPTISDSLIESPDWRYFSAPEKAFLLDNNSIYELVLALDDGTTVFESELMVTGCPTDVKPTIVNLKSKVESFLSAGKLANEFETFTLENDVAQYTEVLFFVNGQFIKSFAKSGADVTIQYPYEVYTDTLVEIYYNYI